MKLNFMTWASALFLLIGTTIKAQTVTANFIVDTNAICSGGTVHVTNLSTGPDTSRLSYEWWIDNGSPQHWYQKNIPTGITFWTGVNACNIHLTVRDTLTFDQDNKMITITIWPIPQNVQISPQNPTLGCSNTPINLSAAGNQIQSYVWTYNGDTVGVTDTITAVAAGQYNIYCTNIYGCKNQWPSNVYVNTSQTPHLEIYFSKNGWNSHSGDTANACQDVQGYKLFANYWGGSGTSTFTWDDSTNLAYGRTVHQGGTYTGTISDQNGCVVKDSLWLFVKQNPTPHIVTEDSTTICSNQSLNLSVDSAYIWYDWNYWGNWNNTDTLIINPGASGSNIQKISLMVTDIFGCTGNDSIEITINTAPPQPTIISSPFGCNLATQNGYSGYDWRDDSHASIPGATTQYYNPQVPGFYMVQVTNQYGCSNLSDPFWSSCITTGVDEVLSVHGFEVKKNSLGDIMVRFGDATKHTVCLFNVIGAMVQKEEGSENILIKNTSAPGLYFVTIDNDPEKTSKILIE